jgi:hypothetical protein
MAPNMPAPAAPAPPAEQPPQAAPLNNLIDPGLLESVQQSIVGLVIVWSEHEDPFAWLTAPPEDPAAPPEAPVMAICTGWFDTPTTIATAGHCVDPEEGRVAMHMERGGIDPETGLPTPVDYTRPAPIPTVYAFQPRELPGAVLTSPVIVRVHCFRKAEDGDTAELEVFGMPPGKPLPIAPNPPRLGEPVVSIGFPGLNISDTDGVDMRKLMEGGQTPADVRQDSRLHPVNTSGTIMSRQFRKGVAVYQVNADFAGGLCGGPTINSHGQRGRCLQLNRYERIGRAVAPLAHSRTLSNSPCCALARHASAERSAAGSVPQTTRRAASVTTRSSWTSRHQRRDRPGPRDSTIRGRATAWARRSASSTTVPLGTFVPAGR